MNWRAKRRLLFAALLILLPILIQVPNAYSQISTSSHLTVSVTGQSLVAGLNNTVTITVANEYSGYIAIYDIDIAVSVPAPLILVGDNHWHYDSILYGQAVTISFYIYAPSSAAGTPVLGTITATYKQLGDVSYTQETHALGLSVTGYINIVVYGIEVTPSQISPGGNTTLSGNVLNNGNLAAYNANVTVQSDELSPGQPASVFLGEVDPNIPRPFSILVVFKPDVQPGNYTVTVRVSVTDNNRPSVPIIGEGNSLVQVTKPTQTGFQRGQARGGIIQSILTFLRNLFNAFFGSSYP